jgi:membrane fusion protein (multidrug efflux system)
VLVVVILAVVKFLQIRRAMMMAPKMGAEAVTTSSVVESTWREGFDTVGTFVAVQGATLSAEGPGMVSRILFESGSTVQRDQVLIELDHSVEDANLAGSVSRAELARQNLARARTLRSQSALSIANLEDAQSKLQQSEAEVRSLRAIIERKTIKAPFAGKTGIRMVNVGEYVSAGTPLVPLHSIDPIFFNFSVPQQIVPSLAVKSPIRVGVDAFPTETFSGEVSAINPNVNQATRTIEIQGSLSNANGKLLPGMFGRVHLDLGAERSVLTIPASSVVYAPYGNFVFVIQRAKDSEGKETLSARQQVVTLGPRRGDLVSVLSGLARGEEIVTTGGFKLRPGMAVSINNQIVPPAEQNPSVQDS